MAHQYRCEAVVEVEVFLQVSISKIAMKGRCTYLSTERIYRLDPLFLSDPMVNHDTIVLQQSRKEQIDFRPAVTLDEVVYDSTVDIVLWINGQLPL